ncbi:MATE family efflux transporter [Sedimentitalea sp. JM2-8]|uniref:MATE family efflux transporter n=1 Tax=Sedimentitalea xiamensis TaxID=3050037 RepID=A0ABT7FIJ0_9RHOB|nr:MATE family efflux transporter [Sedimentitalea xiamensis]MDK3074609.1 MATE family efflux transporter [Sedimentitalea xiamensis]
MTAALAPDRIRMAAAAREARTRPMLEGPIGPTLARLAAPNVLAMVVQALMTIAEGVFAARLGVQALAGLALVFPLVMLTQMLAAGAMGGAISSSVARALGANDLARTGGIMLAAWIIAGLMALGSFLLMGLWARGIFELLGGSGPAAESALAYAGVFFPGCIAIWLCHSTLSIIRGSGGMMFASSVLLCVSLVAIPMAGAMALGWGRLPALGMGGLALGTVVAHGFGAVLALAYLLSGRAGLVVTRVRLRARMFTDILHVGLVASANSVLTILTIVLMVGAVGRHGQDALAGYGLGARLEFLMIPVVFGIGAAMTAMVGANIGAGQTRRALAVAWTGSLAAAGIVGAIGLIVALAPDLWLRMFLAPEDAAALAAGRSYFRIVAPFYGFFAVGLALYFASQGAGRMMWPFLGGVVRMAVAFGGTLLLTQVTDLGVQAVFTAIAAGMFIYGLFIPVSLILTRWR